MDPKIVYWSAALLNMCVLTSFAVAGVRHIRCGEVARHQRAMKIAASLVVFFLVSYPLKLAILGREDTNSWSTLSVNLLRFHELCVFFMLLGGGIALLRGLRLGKTRAVLDDVNAPIAAPESLTAHRRAGRVGVVGAVLAVLSAGFVLAGMFARAS